jgi:hypothetical protein
MFYFMIFHSSISAGKDLDKKTLTTFLYGCVMYIILHALLSSSDRTFFATIQQYFWIIFAIDIICMFYIYFKLIQKNNPGDQSSAVFQNLRSKLAGMLDNFIDTSMYTDEPAIRVIEYPAGSGNIKNDPATRGILRRNNSSSDDNNTVDSGKAVKFADSDDIREIDSNPVTEQDHTQTQTLINNLHATEPIADNIDDEAMSINRALLQISNDLYPTPTLQNNRPTFETNKPPSKQKDMIGLGLTMNSTVRTDYNNTNNDLQRNIMMERASGLAGLPPPPKDPNVRPPELQSSSIDAIRRKVTGVELPTTQLSQMNTKSLLENKANLSNEQLSSIKLDYNPDELVADIFKKKDAGSIQYGKKMDDSTSSVSNNSDLGSMLDFDLNEFASSLST